MLTYNTQQKSLVLPEYGRNIQSMVDHCITIEDREERTRAAYSVVAAMANLFPELKSGGQYSHKLWDHLAIMSDFKLDIDYPCEIIQADNLHTRPQKVGYDTAPNRRRQYGKTIQSMIDQAAQMPEGDERMELSRLIANQMKKTLSAISTDEIEDEKVFSDLYEMSEGAIRLDVGTTKLHQYIVPQPATTSKKKKKK